MRQRMRKHPRAELLRECAIALQEHGESIADGAGTARGTDTEDGWIHGLTIARVHGPGYPDFRYAFPSIRDECSWLAQLENMTVQQVMINKLRPKSELKKHRDGEPRHYRWHLPITTHPSALWWDEIDGQVHMKLGVWHGPVNYCGVLHTMKNGSIYPRIHLIVDLL